MKQANVVKETGERGWCSCFRNFDPLGQWFRVLWKLDDDQMQKMNGTDYTLYLVYLRYAAWLCLIITAANFSIIIPIYATGSP